MVFIVLVYNSGNQNVLINDWYVYMFAGAKSTALCVVVAGL